MPTANQTQTMDKSSPSPATSSFGAGLFSSRRYGFMTLKPGCRTLCQGILCFAIGDKRSIRPIAGDLVPEKHISRRVILAVFKRGTIEIPLIKRFGVGTKRKDRLDCFLFPRFFRPRDLGVSEEPCKPNENRTG